MPRPKKPGSAEPKKRSRNGCWPCKNRKIKCGEERPKCDNCERQGETCDYSIRLNWEGRSKRKGSNETQASSNATSPPAKLHRSSSSQDTVSTTSTVSTIRELSPNPATGFMPTQYASPNYTSSHPAQSSPYRDHISTAQLSRIRDQGTGTYPSPADSSMESPPLPNPSNLPYGGGHHSLSNGGMPPPFQSPQFSFPNHINPYETPGAAFADHTAKKLRLSPSIDSSDAYPKNPAFPPSNFAAARQMKLGPMISPQSMRYQSSSPSNGSVRVPLTPAASSAGSEDIHQSMTGPSPQQLQDSNDFRRLSVKSLLSEDSPADSGSSSDSVFPGKLNIGPFHYQKTTYGVDRGFPDLDLPHNNDMIALSGVTPTMGIAELDKNEADLGNEDLYSEFGFGLNASEGFNEGSGYYASPVTVSISRSLEPLPPTLQDNPMNLLYFHHFVNHTARMLVPHDCSENPFKSILPQMAIHDTNLLNLILTYSASHRSRLLNHPEPATRIALWVQDVFPALRRTLSDPSGHISDSNLATAILLASLEIVNPSTFDVKVPWQQHLHIARRMILARGGANSVHRRDKASYFLTRWFAYLDVMGSLSGGRNDRPLFSGDYWATDSSDKDQDYQIDCLLGFTSRCVSILAKIAELARNCENERIDPAGYVREDWQPSVETRKEAERLKADLMEARMHRYQGCPHRRASTQIEDSSYNLELVTTNEAFHHAGLIHVNRRVLGKSSMDPEVQFAVHEIVSALYKVRKGGTAEGCLLFPMFTAGCDAQEPEQRERIMERLKRMEGLGMSHVRKARALMEKVWETGRPWETLVTGEDFFG